jgi:hypothetical protein
MRNVTAHAPNGYGVIAQPSGTNLSLTLTNVIALGGVRDLDLTANGGAFTHATIAHSNYTQALGAGGSQTCAGCTVTDNGGNQLNVDPTFRDGALRQAAGSPTIDAGTNTGTAGRTDPDGRPRTINGTTDIGAYEQTIAPAVETGEATGITTNAATLGGTVTPNLEATTWRIEYGPTASYGSSTGDSSAGSGGSAQPVSADVSGLEPSTTYHYRVVATNARGTTTGPGRTFTTAAAPTASEVPTAGTPAQGTAARPFAGMTLSKKKVKFRRGVARVSVTCPAAAAGRCTGTLRITARRGGRWVTVARQSFSLAPGQKTILRLRLAPSARRAGLRIRLVARARAGGGPFVVSTVATRLVRG